MTESITDTSAQLIEISQSVGDFAYDEGTRTLRGILLPFGERSRRSATGHEVEFSADAITLPRDPSVVTLNRRHNRHDPVGRATVLEKRDAGVYAEFRVADTDEGDAYLAEQRGSLRKLSAEVADLITEGARALKSRLTGAALVPEGAFASAALFELADPDEEDDDPSIQRGEDATPETPDAAPAEDTQEREGVVMTTSIVPDGVVTPEAENIDLSASALFSALAQYAQTKDRSVMEPFGEAGGDALFAISNIQHAGPTTLTIGADTQTPQFVNEIWARRTYQRKYIPLGLQESLTSMKVQGWKWDPAAEPAVAAYSGNAAEIPSGAVDTIPVTADAVRLAGGHRLDRRFIDFGDQTVYQSYLAKMAESYARVSDIAWLTAAVAGATAVNSSAATVPSGIAVGLGAIVDGALAVIASENTPSFAVVNPALWRNIALTGNKDVLGYLDASLGLEEGQLDGFKIIPGAVATNKVLVGAKEAFTFYELPGAPIRVEGIAPHQGAIDPALFGYYATIVNNATALQLVTCVA